jgi:selenocysteine lyase/cysteine desulfurase
VSHTAAATSDQTLGSAAAPPAADSAGLVQVRARREAAAYASPYLAGVGIGVVLLLSFVLMGRGLGASGAFSSVVAAAVKTRFAECLGSDIAVGAVRASFGIASNERDIERLLAVVLTSG